jgi:hypothetical protein
MPDGTFVEEFVKAVATPQVETVAGEERLLVPSGWQELQRRKPVADALKVGTLTALVDYLKANVDRLDLAGLIVHVENPDKVAVRAKLEDEAALYRRHAYLVATTELVGPAPIQFGAYIDSEVFTVALQYGFVPSTERDELIALVASIRDNAVQETVDDGVAQEVKTARVVALSNRTKVPNPVTLRPYRTFREVQQPESRFILRLKSGQERPLCALFEAEGGAWKLAAIKSIAEFLRFELAEAVTVIA